MHEIISGSASFILSPLLWILVLLVTAFSITKAVVRKWLCLSAIVLFLIFSNARLLNWYAANFQPAPLIVGPGTVYTCGIVPGGFASPDVDGNAVFNSTADRFIQVLKLYKQGQIKHILLAGGNGKKQLQTFREAAWVKNELVIMGVPDSVIFVEDESNNTTDNAVNSKKILETKQLNPPYLLISSAHHLPRATAVFKKAGLQTVAFPCSYIAGRGIHTWLDLKPSLQVLQLWDIFLKETAGYYWYR